MGKEPDNNNRENSMEEIFVKKIQDFVLDNLSCEDFSLERLSHEIGYSRSQIHRKLKKISGKSVSQFVREIRLEEALRLLQQRVGNVSEISFKVGFSSPVYFNKCFNDYFGKTPGEVLKMNSAHNFDPITKTSRAKQKTFLIYFLGFALISTVLYLLIFNDIPWQTRQRNHITIINQDGKSERQEVFNDDQIHKVAISTFLPEDKNDSLNYWLKYGLFYGVIRDLSQFNYVMPYMA